MSAFDKFIDRAKETGFTLAGAIDIRDKEIEELKSYVLKLEALLSDIHKACLCERFKTKGFDYHEVHPRLGKTSGRWKTPRDLIEFRIGFEWRYSNVSGCCDSWKEFNFREMKPERDGFK